MDDSSEKSAAKSRKDRRKNKRKDRDDGKKSTKKEDDLEPLEPSEIAERLVELEDVLERHKFHISRLESLLRMLDNGSLEASELEDSLREDIEQYCNDCEEPDFDCHEFDYLYDEYEDGIAALAALVTLPQQEAEGSLPAGEELTNGFRQIFR